MKKVLLLNDTSNYHSGSKQVITALKTIWSDYDISPNHDIKEADIVLANGEGSLHDNKEVWMIRALEEARFLHHKKTALINAVWMNNSQAWARRADAACHYISFREVKSRAAFQYLTNRADAKVNLDLSYFGPVEDRTVTEIPTIVTGGIYDDKKVVTLMGVGEDYQINIFEQDWSTIVATLKRARLLVSGRHHELYAACVASCPFVAIEGNTWKNSGLADTVGPDLGIPVLPLGASHADIKAAIVKALAMPEAYGEFFKRMRDYPMPAFMMDEIEHVG